jgi:hypothetical protein
MNLYGEAYPLPIPLGDDRVSRGLTQDNPSSFPSPLHRPLARTMPPPSHRAATRSRQVQGPDPHGPPGLEGRNHSGNPPLVELAAADLEEAGELGFSQQLKLAARQRLVRVLAHAFHVNRCGGDTWQLDNSIFCKNDFSGPATITANHAS